MSPLLMPAPNDPVVYRNRACEGRPGLHALIVGVSAYPHLPRPGTNPPPEGWPKNNLGLVQLDSAALGASRIARWLIAHHGQLTPPLASARLLLTPTAADAAVPDGPAGFVVPEPTLENLAAAAEAWRTDADGHSDSTTLFYFAGHGVQRRVHDHVLLLHDFGRSPGTILASTVNTTNLIDGMRLAPSRTNLARRQLYFFDACKLRPEVFDDYDGLTTPAIWDAEAVDTDDRQYGIFYATAPGRSAYGNVGGHSLFCEALLWSLNGGAAVPGAVNRPSNPLPWRVTIGSLKAALEEHLKVVATNAGTTQTLGSEVLGTDFQFRTFAAIPEVKIEINVNPGHATKCAGLVLRSVTGEPVKQVDPPLASNPHIISVQAGGYIFQAADRGVPPQYTSPDAFILNAVLPRNLVAIDFRAVNS